MSSETKIAEELISHRQVFPGDANPAGNMFGGRIMEIMDSVAGMAAHRFAIGCQHCVTASAETIQFPLPVHIGDVLKFIGKVVYTGRTSMVVRVDAIRSERNQPPDELCTTAHLILVAMDTENKPMPVPQLAVTTDEDKKAWELGKAVRDQSLKIKSAQS